jgi:thiamine-monophosphate kinase
MNELQILERIRRKSSVVAGSSILLGIGDDCAVFRPRGAQEDLLLTTDMVVEDIHFHRDTHPAAAVGYRTLARGLSDIAAMGGKPRFCLLSLVLAPWADSKWIDKFYSGLLDLAGQTGTMLAGGDLAGGEKLTCDIVVCGSAPKGKALRRDGARPGDQICVSGHLGASALGLEKGKGEAWRRHLRPAPRLALGRYLRTRLHATAAMDLSDGLSLDLHRLCLASGAMASLDREPPIFSGANSNQALHGGEDYELLFTLPARIHLPDNYNGIPLTRIGTIQKGKPGLVELLGRPLSPRGYDHFRRSANASKRGNLAPTF